MPSPVFKTLLTLDTDGFRSAENFLIFVSKILTLRDTETELHGIDLVHWGVIEPQLLNTILNYVCSHNTHIQQLAIDGIADSYAILSCVSSCRALTSLKLHGYHKSGDSFGKKLFPKSLNLPALTNLDLADFIFCASDNADRAEPFSAFNSLHRLTIACCTVRDAQILSISNGTLVDLTMYNNSCDFTKIELSTPKLYTFYFYSTPCQTLCGSGLSSVKHVYIDVQKSFRFEIVLSWLQDFPNVISLTVTPTTIQVLSLVPDLFKVKLHSLCNLKSLKVKGGVSTSATIPDRIVDFLLQNSPTAKVDLIDHWTRI